MISFGNITAKAVYYGSLAINAVYAGAVKVWEKVAGLKNYIIKGNASVVDGKVKGVGDEFQFNQQMNPTNYPDSRTSDGIAYSNNGDGAITANGTATAVGGLQFVSNYPIVGGHKYLLCGCDKRGGSNAYLQIYDTSFNTSEYGQGSIFTPPEAATKFTFIRFRFSIGYVAENFRVCPQLFDLTAMGIADRVNSLADFKAYLVERGMMQSVDDELPYFGYDAGSTKTSMPIVARSANLWDEEWEVGSINISTGGDQSSTTEIRSKNYDPCSENTTYYFGGYLIIAWYNSSKAKISVLGTGITGGALTSPSGAAFFRICTRGAYGTTYNHDIMINEGSTATPYVPYYRKTYPCLISSPLFKVGNVADAAEFKTQKITRAFAKIVFNGTEEWRQFTASDSSRGYGSAFYPSIMPSGIKYYEAGVYGVLLAAGYRNIDACWNTAQEESLSTAPNGFGGVIIVTNKANSVDTWKAYLAEHPLEVIYELATPIEESAVLPAVTEWQDGYILTTDTEIAPSEVVTEV